MNLKMNRSKSLGSYSKITSNSDRSSILKKVKGPTIRIKQEIPVPEEEVIQSLNIDENRTFKIEIEDEGEESLELSGVSENSNSPSPSPPPAVVQSKVASNVPIPVPFNGTDPSLQKAKPLSQTFVLNKVLPQQGVAKAGSPIPGIFLIDSRPYQLIPNQVSQNYSARELQGLQLKVLSTIQQQHQQQQKNLQSSSSSPSPSLSVSQQDQNHSPDHETFNTSRSESVQVAAPTPSESDRSYTQESVETQGEEDATMYSEPEYESDSVQNKDQDTQDASGGSQDATNNSADADVLIPNLFNETGAYDFKVLLDPKEDTLKTPTWLVSNITKKLYTNMNKPIPFRVILNKHYPRKRFHLRALAVFKYPMSQRQNVVRCPNHLNPTDCTNIDFPHINHVIRADHPRASYESTSSGRLSVVVPLDFPESRNEAIPILFKFMCHNSCVGGIHRRPMVVLLTLELNEKEVGRFAIDVRVCACPSRDVKTEEKHHIARGLFKNAGHVFESRRNRKRPRNEDANSNDDDEEILYLPVRGTALYNYLKDVKQLYLKHHPDYARRFPDPPDYPDPHSRYADSSNQYEHSQESTEPAEEVHPTDSPQADPLEIPVGNEKSQSLTLNDKSQRVFFLYPNSGAPENTKIYNGDGISIGNIVSPVLHKKVSVKMERLDSEYSVEVGDGVPNNSATSSNSDDKPTKKKNKSQLERSKSDIVRSHLQVVSMPVKEKSTLKVLTGKKKSKKDRNCQDEASEESEKVMLAARVLASHLGSHQFEK
ncbi:Cellular tumor antigen p53 [Armadillidium nasatum]|uniref:Cellular tumor antigen p53 n=1 Tax=Armadillidium nasatum TaxID=96803 RepID=A0A5N5SMH8_9CRUS|nr:Cellular tumor antigen p53 [Armadillidium nasatum]